MTSKYDSSLSARKLFICNRGEIAVRIAHTAQQFPLPSGQHTSSKAAETAFHTVSIHTTSEKLSQHVVRTDSTVYLGAEGPRAYLDIPALVSAAQNSGAWGVIPGYGFLSESAAFGRAVEEAGMVFVGPTAEQLALFGDKTRARDLASQCNVPLLPGTSSASSHEQVSAFAKTLPPGSKVMLKAVAGGGGRGMSIVDVTTLGPQGVAEAYQQCVRQAEGAFGDGRVFAERYLEGARHVEVQVIGDGTGDVAHLFERECTLQRRHQKLVEICPSPSISPALRNRLIASALKMAQAGKYKSLGTFEFLVLPESSNGQGEYFFMEANPRIQVEHTVTEQVTGLDLVALQLQIALGATLADLGLGGTAAPLQFPSRSSIQLRVNAETFDNNGEAFPSAGVVTALALPSGPGIRVDTAAHAPLRNGARYNANPAFDSLFLKLICTAPTYGTAFALASRSLNDLVIKGCPTNQFFLQALLSEQAVRRNVGVHTAFVQTNFDALYAESSRLAEAAQGEAMEDSNGAPAQEQLPDDARAIELPMAGIVTAIEIKEGEPFVAGQQLAIIEAMKMEHVIRAPQSGTLKRVLMSVGDSVQANTSLFFYTAIHDDAGEAASSVETTLEDLDLIRPELESLFKSRHLLTDEFRSAAVAKRRALGYLTARENLSLLVDENSFIEYGDLQMAAQRSRIDAIRLRETTMGDGVITGFGTINSENFEERYRREKPSPARVALCIYDYLVLAGTQGHFHHLKLDRLFQLALTQSVPLVLYAEGGGGRPGDTDVMTKVAGLDTPSFVLLGHIRARGIPTIGVASGNTFAGNAALLGTCDLIIATLGGEGLDEQNHNSTKGRTSIGMSGPAMIEGAKLGKHKAAEIGPSRIHAANGNVDLIVASEREAASAVKQILSFFQGPQPLLRWQHTSDARRLRHLIPADRKRAYNVRAIIEHIADDGSFIELAEGAPGKSIMVGFMRVEGHPLAVVASSVISPLGGAIDAPSALKATRHLELLTRTQATHLLVLSDTPGFMVGPAAERAGSDSGIGQVKAFGDWFAAAAAFTQSGGQVFAVTLRKAYGLGAQAVLGGSTLHNFFSASWPTGEFAGMGPEGAVRLAMRKELASIKDEQQREETYSTMVQAMYDRGKAENMAAMAEIDTVIDPVETRPWILRGMATVQARTPLWKLGGRSSKI